VQIAEYDYEHTIAHAYMQTRTIILRFSILAHLCADTGRQNVKYALSTSFVIIAYRENHLRRVVKPKAMIRGPLRAQQRYCFAVVRKD